MTEREKEILAIIRDNPTISQDELAFELGISRSGVAAHIHNLMKKGYIKGKGYIVDNPDFISVIGGINMDIVGIPTKEMYQNNSNSGKINYYFGGAGRNMALALTKLGISTSLISVYGDDANGEQFVTEARRQGLNIACCEKVSGFNTSTFIYLEDKENDLRLGLDDMRILENITPELINRYLKRINQSKYCVIDDNLPLATMDHLAKYVEVPIIAKSVSIEKVKKLIPVLHKLELLVLSDKELAALVRETRHLVNGMGEEAKHLIHLGVKQVVVICDNGDTFFFENEKRGEIKRSVTPTFNLNGSSAVLTSSIIWGKIQGTYTYEEEVRIGCAGSLTSFLTNDSVFSGLSEELMLDNYRKHFIN